MAEKDSEVENKVRLALLEQGHKEIKEDLAEIKQALKKLTTTAVMGAGAWKAIMMLGGLLSVIWTALKITGKWSIAVFLPFIKF